MKNLSSFQLDVYSGSAAFFLFISVFPFVMIILSVIPKISVSQADVTAFFTRLIPPEFHDAALVLIRDLYGRSSAILPLSVVAAVWSSSRGIMAITKGLNRINNVEENRNYLIRRLNAILYTIALVVSVLLLILLGVFGKRILRLIDLNFSEYIRIANSFYRYVDVFLLLILFVLFLLLYTFLPARHMVLRYQFPGALLATLIWWAFTELFSYYILHFNAYSMYGSLAAVVILMVWMYAGMYFFFFGAWLNYRMGLK
ncbi:MAG: YihY/virulence factor BrkB family protein [Lachnospiraceae bacterium]|nr:YihY/virulence factor BrkB family protein [Lachnospiraceae bacterium]